MQNKLKCYQNPTKNLKIIKNYLIFLKEYLKMVKIYPGIGFLFFNNHYFIQLQ